MDFIMASVGIPGMETPQILSVDLYFQVEISVPQASIKGPRRESGFGIQNP